MKGISITGRKENIAYDFYETPKWATEKAIKAMLRDGILSKKEYVYEPCVGEGVDVYEVEDNACDVVITNPPYNLMTKGNMLAEFQRIAEKKVILLLNIFYLSSKERKQMLKNSNLRHIYIHSDRVTMFPYGQERPKNGGTKMYAWYVWDKEYTGKPTLSWI